MQGGPVHASARVLTLDPYSLSTQIEEDNIAFA